MLPPETIALLGLAAGTAGFIDSIAGGGGLITVPALLAAGLPPVNALATNKLQSVFSQIMSTWRYASRGLIEFRSYGPVAVGVFIASKRPPSRSYESAGFLQSANNPEKR